MERVGGQLGDVALRRHEASEGARDLVGADQRGVEHAGALDELDDRARGRRERAAALGVEARLGHAVALHADGEADEVAAGGSSRRTGVRMPGEGAAPARRIEVFGETAQGLHASAAGRGSRGA